MRRRFTIALAIYVLAHLYIWWRLILPLGAPSAGAGTALAVALAPTFPLMRRFGRLRSRERARPWLLLGYVWFGLATYLLLGALASHIAVACGVDAGYAARLSGTISIAVVVAGVLNVARGPIVKRTQIPLRRLGARSYTIAHLTDVHIGALIGRAFAEELVRRVNALAPDLIVITGDLIDGQLSELQPHIEPLRELRARDGIYAVTGNHEYYWNVEPWLAHLGSLGIRVLRNQHVTIAGAFVLAGVDDSSAAEDVPGAVAGRDPQLPLVLLAHHPRTITRAVAAGVDLQLSGHTHGGQMLPWGWLARIWDPLVSGLRRFGDTWLYVSAGTGFWGPPMRIGTSCEIAAITLVPATFSGFAALEASPDR